jgi:transcriptional regulator GlxA family with amidase domain
MQSFTTDAIARFARACQLAAGECIPPTTSVRIVCAASAALTSFPETVPREVLATVLGALNGLARHTLTPRTDNARTDPHTKLETRTPLIAELALNLLIEKHTCISLSTHALACELGLSPACLTREIRNATGGGVRKHLSLVRFLSAVSLLLSTHTPVADLSRAAGYHHTGELDRDCRRWLHMTPSDVRRGAQSWSLRI